VRQPDEWRDGHLPDAVLLPLAEVPVRIVDVVPERDRPVVLYCAVGARSMAAARHLHGLGYGRAVSLRGGFVRWKAEGRPWQIDAGPGDAPLAPGSRYSRQLVMPEVGAEGQARLAAARVLVVGAGGLGSPSLLYLAAAGIGTIGVVDFDTVDVSNLQRQVVHSHARLGRRKSDSAAAALHELNPEISVVAHDELLDAGNAGRLVAGHDVVIDGSDTFPTRYALNDACVAAGIPLVHASVYRFEGQLTVLAPPAGPCYRCLFPQPPADAEAYACAVTGVLGVVPGVMGLLQATEALKLVLRIGRPLIGRLLVHDALEGTFEEVRLQRDPGCPVCSRVQRTP
jgi:sulfur-carrier protein adenylyltransferase/sulfurtransferase